MNRAVKQSQGFTIIELLLAMTFISVLLIGIALTIIQIGTIYNKGSTIKETNQAARNISNDLARTFAEARPIVLATDLREVSAGGRLCLGTYSYVWNTLSALQNLDGGAVDGTITKYQDAPDKEVHFLKVPDPARIYCSVNPTTGAFVYANIRTQDAENSQELLPSGDHTLNITQFALPAASLITDPSTEQVIYTVRFTIGSGKGQAMNADQSACLPPTNQSSDLTYCNVQQFTIVLRTGNGVNYI